MPHFSHLCSVSTTEGTGLPSGSMLNDSLHSGNPEHERNFSPRLFSRIKSGLPHLGQACSLSTASARGWPPSGRVALHSGYFEQPRNWPVLPNLSTMGALQTWQISLVGIWTRSMCDSAAFSSSWNG